MCGIAGFIDFKKATDENILKHMADAVHHRGRTMSVMKYMMHLPLQ